MALTNEDIFAISQLLDTKLDEKLDNKLKPINERLESVDNRLDSVELQVKHTERVLRNEIRSSEHLILSEVERVHKILDKHKEDKSKHTA